MSPIIPRRCSLHKGKNSIILSGAWGGVKGAFCICANRIFPSIVSRRFEEAMKPLALALLLLCLSAALVTSDPPAAKTHAVTLNGHTFTLLAGFTIELAARSPLVDRPIVADFDEQGRLYVADSSGSNAPVKEQVKTRTHRIVRLESSRGDGVFDRSTVFADRMMFPEGVMWLDGSLYVAAPPSIWKLTDTKGTGKADQRVEWFEGKTLTGCANDLHGPYRGPDGWIYWCKGAFAQQTYKRPGKKDLVTRAAHIFRARPDGTGIEPVMTGGMDNPVDVVFTPGGERIFTTTFFQHPAGGRRDGLVHAVYGGVYGKDHGVVYDHPWTSPALMPVLTHLGPAAPAGLTRYESDVFGKEYQDNLFAALFNMQKVTRHVLIPDGATFKTRDEDFLVSSNRDFHPTDVLEDADGSLLVVDTGGWYKLCCPTSQLGKPDVLGAIYRIRREGAARVADPRGAKINWATKSANDLAHLLGDRRPAVRARAIATLARKGNEAVRVLVNVQDSSVEARRNAVWTGTRIDGEGARALVRKALADGDKTVRQCALHSISVRRDRGAVADVTALLMSKSPHNRRAAAEALGRIGTGATVPALLAAVGDTSDRVLEHSLTYALIEIANREATAEGLSSANARTRRAALIALDGMDGGALQAKTVSAHLTSHEPALKEAAWWIAGRHPEWGGELTGFFRTRLAASDLTAAERAELPAQLARVAKTPAIQELLQSRLVDKSARREEKRLVLRAMAGAALKPVPAGWVAALTEVLSGGDGELVREAVSTARALPLAANRSSALTRQLLALAGDEKAAAEVRLGALAAVPGGLRSVKAETFAFLRSRLLPELPVAERGLASEVLVKANLTAQQLGVLAESLDKVGPMELDRLLEAFARATDESAGMKLLAAIERSPVRSSVRVAGLRARLAKYSDKVRQSCEALCAKLDAELTKQREQLDRLLAEMKGGDVRRGQAVFNSTKAACVSCHAIGYLGGKVGPDLTQIGKIRSDRDLLESILFPSASFVRSYEPVLVTTIKGKQHNGLVRKDSPEEIVLVTSATEEVRIARKEIESMEPSKVSLMPAGLDKVLSRQELADLVAFLRACR
jgi:putative membrane-bound dehydrogenase-like protein